MSSIIREGDTFHGISVESRGVFTDDEHGETYAGQCKDGYAYGLGVLTRSDGTKDYAEHGPDGKSDGRNLRRWADGDTTYRLYERGEPKAFALVSADGDYLYNHVFCAPNDPRVLALIAQVAPVEVRPAAPAPHPPSLPTRSHAIVRWTRRLVLPRAGAGDCRGHRGASPRRTPSLVAARHTHASNSRNATHDQTKTRARTILP
jgi:hypothetical protein